MSYDYKAGKERIENILWGKLTVIDVANIPSDSNFTFDNAYYGWVTAIFVDIRNSSELFSSEDKVEVSKIIRSFTSEVIEILREDDNHREIGIRGDCVYAIYPTPNKDDIYELMDKIFYVNTLLGMLNALFKEKGYNTISVGIGIASAQELVVKAGRKDVGINSKVWIGDAVTKASNLSSIGSKIGNRAIIVSSLTYDNMIEILTKYSTNAPSWFSRKYHADYGYYYEGSVIKTEFNNWINEGME